MALSDFLNGYTSVSLYSRCYLCSHSVHVAQKNITCWTKKCYVLHKKVLTLAQKTVASTKKIFHLEVQCAPKLCESQKNMFLQQKNYVTPKTETHVD